VAEYVSAPGFVFGFDPSRVYLTAVAPLQVMVTPDVPRQRRDGQHAALGVDVDAVHLGVQYEGIMVKAALAHVGVVAQRVFLDAERLELHGVDGGVPVFDDEVDAGRQEAVGDGHDVHAVDAADDAVLDRLLAQLVDADDLFGELCLDVDGLCNEQHAVLLRHQVVVHGGAGRHDGAHYRVAGEGGGV
jgi:hypothetical protein